MKNKTLKQLKDMFLSHPIVESQNIFIKSGRKRKYCAYRVSGLLTYFYADYCDLVSAKQFAEKCGMQVTIWG